MFMFLLVSIFCCDFICCVSEGKVFMTMVTTKPYNAESSYPQYYCYLNSPDTDATVTTRRFISTRDNSTIPIINRNPAPTSQELLTIGNVNPPVISGSAVYLAKLNFPNIDFAFGTFACDAEKSGRVTVSNILMRSDATIVPYDLLVTQTVNVGDVDVRINMRRTTSLTGNVIWRRNGVVIVRDSPLLTYSISSISRVNEGIYECHYSGQRYTAFHGLLRLIVRECQSNHWGLPGCEGICDNCYNGGICDDETGICICPPGFMGTNCLTGCGGNRFGYNCEFQCSSGPSEYACSAKQFCLVDPYGCSCATGLKTLACSSLCTPGHFGASCRQDCHCVGTCNVFTGECSGYCETGWSGTSCQIPNVCTGSDFYGFQCLEKCHCKDDLPCNQITGECPNMECSVGYLVYAGSVICQECQGAYHGVSCLEECRCTEDICNKVTGYCDGSCTSTRWVAIAGCQQGITGVTFDKVNSRQPVLVTCTYELQRYRNTFRYSLSRAEDAVNNDGILSKTSSSEYSTFEVDNVSDGGDRLYCILSIESVGRIYATLPVYVSVYALPTLNTAPTSVSVSSTSVTIVWAPWNPDVDTGDPPVVAYIPYYKMTTADEWNSGSVISQTETPEFTLSNLQKDTNYTFSIAAVREGLGGEGPRGPVLIINTNCNDVPIIPVDVVAIVTATNQINISWQIPADINPECISEIRSFNIYLTNGMNQFDAMVTESQTYLTDVLPIGEYTIHVSTKTDIESKRSLAVIVKIKGSVKPPDATTQSLTGPVEPMTGASVVIIIISVIALLFVVCIVVAAGFFIRMKRRRYAKDLPSSGVSNRAYANDEALDNCTNDTQYAVPDLVKSKGDKDKNEMKAETTSVKLELKPVMVVVPISKMVRMSSQEEEPDSEDDILHGEDEDMPAEQIYGNLLKPDPIRVSELKDYIRRNADNLGQEFTLLKKGQLHPWTVGGREENKKKNRFRKLFTYDHNRVVLDKLANDDFSDYYNASFIMNQHGQKAFIACQGPNLASLNDFWRMIWQQKISTIVMVTNLAEMGKERCLQYWPQQQNNSRSFGAIDVTWVKTEEFSNHVIRTLQICMRNVKHTVQQLHFLTWPDMDTPKQPSPLIEFVKQIKTQQKGKNSPLLVHCSAGVGRTGTFISLFCLMEMLQTEKFISIYDFVETMREGRVNMVQTIKQYTYLYKCVLEFHLSNHTEIPAGLLSVFDIEAKRDILFEEFKLLKSFDDDKKAARIRSRLTSDDLNRSRFSNLIPYDECRPYLLSEGSTNKENYINAVMVESFRKKNAFIITQSPLPTTIEDFWRLVYDWKCPLIVMLNQLDPNDETCVQYWPDVSTSTTEFGNMTVTCITTEERSFYTYRVFEVSHVHSQRVQSVYHLQLNTWSAKNNEELLGLINDVNGLQHHHNMKEPTLVHCIDGVGRSAVLVTVISEMERIKSTSNVDVFNTVKGLRTGNPNLINNIEDYILCYQSLKAHMNNTSTYENYAG